SRPAGGVRSRRGERYPPQRPGCSGADRDRAPHPGTRWRAQTPDTPRKNAGGDHRHGGSPGPQRLRSLPPAWQPRIGGRTAVDRRNCAALSRTGNDRSGHRQDPPYPKAWRAVDVERAFHPCNIPAKRQMTEEKIIMKAIVVTDQAAGTAGMTLVERPEPPAAINDVVVQVYASGFVPTEVAWPSTWTDRRDRDRTPSIPGHELAGVVSSLGYGTTGLSVGQRVFGLADWHSDGILAECAAF